MHSAATGARGVGERFGSAGGGVEEVWVEEVWRPRGERTRGRGGARTAKVVPLDTSQALMSSSKVEHAGSQPRLV